MNRGSTVCASFALNLLNLLSWYIQVCTGFIEQVDCSMPFKILRTINTNEICVFKFLIGNVHRVGCGRETAWLHLSEESDGSDEEF